MSADFIRFLVAVYGHRQILQILYETCFSILKFTVNFKINFCKFDCCNKYIL